MRRHAILISGAVALASGCGGGNGSDLGRFEVEALRTESCGDSGLLASPPSATLKVWLRRVGDQGMHWDDGNGRVMGFYDPAARSFAMELRLQVDLRQGDDSMPSCLVTRRMTITGELDDDPDLAHRFSGEQRYDYEASEETCESLPEVEQAVFDSLPCSVAYELTGERM